MRWFWRVGAAVVGLVIGVAAGAVSLFTVGFAACVGAQETSDSWICEGVFGALLEPVELILFAAVFCGPIAGGVASARTGRSKPLMIGIAVAAACYVVLFLLGQGQEATLG
jgi:hypothetical protein